MLRRHPPLADKAAFSINEFCLTHGVCRATFNNWRRQGIAPATMKVGFRVLIGREAISEWRRRFEQQPAPQRETEDA